MAYGIHSTDTFMTATNETPNIDALQPVDSHSNTFSEKFFIVSLSKQDHLPEVNQKVSFSLPALFYKFYLKEDSADNCLMV